MADSLPNDTIGLIPCGQSGVNIEHFMPGGKCNASYCVPYPGQNAYEWKLKRCQNAIKRGILVGIMLHQGESNNNDGDAWLTKVKTIYDDLKKDIPLKNDIPIVAGQLLGSSPPLNSTIAKMSQKFTYGYYASSSGLQGGGTYSSLHFNQDGYRTLAKRYAVEMMKGLRAATPDKVSRFISPVSFKSRQTSMKVYSLTGRLISTGNAMTTAKTVRPGNIYVVADKKNGAALKLMVAPSQR
jgi:hypothetical protein